MRILIVDDHAIVRKGLIQIIEEAKFVSKVDEADEGKQALDLLSKNKYDVVIIDLAMPGMDGFEILELVKKSYSGQKVLVLSSYSEELYGMRLIKAGADGYLRKTSAPGELLNALVKIANGEKYITTKLAQEMVEYIQHPVKKKPHDILSEREFQVMLKIAEGKNLTEIAEELLLSKKTISTYRSRLLEKMKIKNNNELIKYVIEQHLLECN